MNKDKILFSIIDTISPQSSGAFQRLQRLAIYRDVPKNEIFIKTGKNDHFEYFVLDGVIRSFLINPDGEEVTISFFAGPSVLSPHVTRTAKNISNLNFQALNDTALGMFDANKFLQLMIEDPDVREFGNSVLKNELLQKVSKEIGLASLTAKERLLKFREDFPGLENLVPQPTVASYLGITNVSLSRLRGQISRLP